MINRSLLRIKVIQILYSYYKNKENETIELESAENELIESTDKTYELYHYFFLLIIKIADYAKRMEKKEAAAGLNISKFNNNLFIEQLRKNNALLTYFNDHDVDWADIVEGNELFWTIQYEEQQNDLIKELFNQIKELEEFQKYLETKENNYIEDKEIWRSILRKTISDSESLGRELEDMSIYWNDDAADVISFVSKTIRNFDEAQGADQELMPQFKDEEDLEFAKKLLKQSIYDESDYRKLISERTKNWDADRIAYLDTIVMQTALAEICNFPTIPVNVSINEYIEIAKNYSTAKSGLFINGILDAIAKELVDSQKVKKVVFSNTYKK
ncbi:MAG: transcription antitermination factor NusB [Paludibacteraceae bacterium]|nr:transcription antitermination factor NusB [Paludibacteraceae bacterium]